jgi:ornithine cyclodeaminase/alanine dehydrogenase-like protein (mu-crystallin family)
VYHITNDDVLRVLSMEDTIQALRTGFDQLAERDAAHVPRLELWTPVDGPDAYYCLGSMAGTTKHFGVTAIRIKSDVLSWPEGARQEKFAVRPGTYCGFILLFSTNTGEPLALINDGVLQRMRVGGSAGIGIDLFAPGDADTIGILGAGDMAREYLTAISSVRRLRRVRVFSPTPENRIRFAREMSATLDLDVEPVESAQHAVSDAQMIATATNAMAPTMDPAWLAPGATVVCVTRREVGPELVSHADRVFQLGAHSIGPESNVPDLEWPQSAAGGFIAGTPQERSRLPWKAPAEAGEFPSIIDVMRGEASGRRTDAETVLFLNTGLQGIQFASVGGRVLELISADGGAAPIDGTMFLQDIRD